MAQEKNRYSDEEILHLIKKAEHLNLAESIDAEIFDEELRELPSLRTRLFIPLVIFAFIASALYFYVQEEPISMDIVTQTTKELALVQKKIELSKVADLRLVQVEDTLKELAHIRKEHLTSAKDQLLEKLKENEETPLNNLETTLQNALANYIKVENEESSFLLSSLEELFHGINSQKREDVELFQLLVNENRLEFFLTPELSKALASKPKIKKLNVKNLHAKIWHLQ